MRDFKKSGFGGKRGGFSRDQGERTMYKATCGTCLKDCEVPFEPTTGKPVLCSDCFKSSGPRKDSRGEFNKDRDGRRRDFTPQQKRSEMSESIVFKIDKLQKQFDSLEEKINHILTAMNIAIPSQKKSLDGLKEVLGALQNDNQE